MIRTYTEWQQTDLHLLRLLRLLRLLHLRQVRLHVLQIRLHVLQVRLHELLHFSAVKSAGMTIRADFAGISLDWLERHRQTAKEAGQTRGKWAT